MKTGGAAYAAPPVCDPKRGCCICNSLFYHFNNGAEVSTPLQSCGVSWYIIRKCAKNALYTDFHCTPAIITRPLDHFQGLYFYLVLGKVFFMLHYDIINSLSHPFWQQEGGACMEHILSFLVSVAASVVGYYIRKWLDGHDKGDN